MKFLLIEPSHYRRKRSGFQVQSLSLPPIGLAYLAAVLKKFGTVTALDAASTGLEHIRRILGDSYDFILFTVTSFNYLDACAIAEDFSLASRATLVIGGPHVAIDQKEIFLSGPWHYAVVGEGEGVCEHLFGGSGDAAKAFPGLLRRDNPVFLPPERISALNELPRPDYAPFPMNSYMYHVILSSRGCPFACSFCAIRHIWGRHWYYRSIPDVLDEMESVRKQYGDKVFHINDDNFTLRPERVEEFTSGLMRKKSRFRWIAQGVRADKVNRKILKMMRKSGCERISIGVESADPAVLKAIGKQETVEQIEKAIWMARDAGIEVLSMFVIGTATETRESIQRSFAFARKNALFPLDFYQLIPHPGTVEWDAIQKNGSMLISDYRQFDHYSSEPVFETPQFTVQDRRDALKQAQELSRLMERKWYVRKHLRFLLPHIWLRHTAGDILREKLFWLRLPFKIVRWYGRKAIRMIRGTSHTS